MTKFVVAGLVALSILHFSCNEETSATAAPKTTEVHFTLTETYDGILEVEVDGMSKVVIPGTGSLDPCDGRTYTGVATYSFELGATKAYVIRNLSGDRLGNGSVTANTDCVVVQLD